MLDTIVLVVWVAFNLLFWIGWPLEGWLASRRAKKAGYPRPNPIGDLEEEDDLPDA